MSARTTVLESCHDLTARRPQFRGSTMVVKCVPPSAYYQVRTAACGCENRTRTSDLGPTCDGVTDLCDEHAQA